MSKLLTIGEQPLFRWVQIKRVGIILEYYDGKEWIVVPQFNSSTNEYSYPESTIKYVKEINTINPNKEK